MDLLRKRTNWYNWFEEAVDADKIALLRKRTAQDLPTGSDDFLVNLEAQYGIRARPPKLGRPKSGKS